MDLIDELEMFLRYIYVCTSYFKQTLTSKTRQICSFLISRITFGTSDNQIGRKIFGFIR